MFNRIILGKMKNYITLAATLCVAYLAVSCDKNGPEGNGNDLELNPDPVQIDGIRVMKATFSEADFNMLSEPGFEDFSDQTIDYRSLWYFEGVNKDPVRTTASADAHEGKVSVQLDNPDDGVWTDGCLQSVALKKGKDYTMTCYGKAAWAGMNAYAGVRLEGGDIMDGQVSDWNPDEWLQYTREFNSGDYVQGNVFFGGWGFPGVWVRADDFRLIPTGTAQTSLKSDSCTESGTLTNASFTDIGTVLGIVAWPGPDGMISLALTDVEYDGTVWPNVYAVSNDTDPSDGFHIARICSGDGIVPILAPSGSDEIACVPTAGVTVNGVQYIHYYSLRETDPEDDQVWTANFSGLLSSADGGQTWTREARARWSGAGPFVQTAFWQDSRYLYMFGSGAGRKTPQIYVARIALDGEINNASAWTYWDGSEWVTGDPEAAAAVTYGTASEMTVTYSSTRQRLVMMYRSDTTGGLVFRDAGAPEGDWSGEKILLSDENENTHYFKPSVLSVSGDDVYMLVSEF